MYLTNTGYLGYRKEKDLSSYPFTSRAKLRNSAGDVIIENTFIDLSLYPIGIDNGAYLSQVEITADRITLRFGDDGVEVRAEAAFDVINPPEEIPIVDLNGLPAGVIVSDAIRLNAFRSWSVGLHRFDPADTELVAAVVLPQPQQGVRAVSDTAGEVATGDVWLIGEDGIVLQWETVTEGVHQITVNAVGDPLFKRRLCEPNSQFHTARYVKSILVRHPAGSFIVTPDQYGIVGMSIDNTLNADTPLALIATKESIDLAIPGGKTTK